LESRAALECIVALEKLELTREGKSDEVDMPSDEIGVIEAVVTPDSQLVNSSVGRSAQVVRSSCGQFTWPILIMLGVLIPVSDALRTTGVTDLIAAWLSNVGSALPPMGSLALQIAHFGSASADIWGLGT